jgi:hypothetical protein
MSHASQIPLVLFYLDRGNDLQVGYGYLNKNPDDRLWLFPNQQTFDANPALAGAIHLDARQRNVRCAAPLEIQN